MIPIYIRKITREAIVDVARNWLGTPYLHQASQRQIGCDCLGLLRGIWRELFKHEPQKIPNYSADWGECGQMEYLLDAADKYLVSVSNEAADIGDVILFRWNENSIVKHIGIKTEKAKFIHAYEKSGVVENPLTRDWENKIAGIFSFPGLVK